VASALAVAIGVDFGCSYWLWRWGLAAMWVRYPLALGASYFTFLFLLGMFAARAARHLSLCNQVRRDALRRQYHSDDGELPDGSGLFDNMPDVSDDIGQALGDPRAIPAYLMLLMSVTIVVVCVYFIWMAPVLLAELVIEGSLAAWLYRPLLRGPQANWFSVALEQTGLAAVIVALCLTLTGIGFQLFAPRATNVVEVWREIAQTR
jgi:hypothetical protein